MVRDPIYDASMQVSSQSPTLSINRAIKTAIALAPVASVGLRDMFERVGTAPHAAPAPACFLPCMQAVGSPAGAVTVHHCLDLGFQSDLKACLVAQCSLLQTMQAQDVFIETCNEPAT